MAGGRGYSTPDPAAKGAISAIPAVRARRGIANTAKKSHGQQNLNRRIDSD
jgi:hypothetical protein